MSDKGWIGVDLDGTLAHYEGWQGIEHIGEPIPAMIARVRSWLASGIEVRIVTARAFNPNGSNPSESAATDIVKDWLEAQGLPRLVVTCVKDYSMLELWDDRAVQVEINTGLAYVHPHGMPTP